MTSSLVLRAPDAALTAKARRELGFVPSVLHYLGACPWLAHAEIAFYAARPIHLSTRVCELVPYVVALERGSRHVSGALAAFLRLAGYAGAELSAIERGMPFAPLAPTEALALEHAVAVARAGGRDTLARLAGAGYGPAARAELTALAALVVFGADVASPLAIPPDGIEAFERGLLAKLLRPLIRRRIAAGRRTASPPSPPGASHGVLFPRIVAGLAGSPLHAFARDALAAAWRSPVLPVRDKAAIIEAVAEGLGATSIADDARVLLEGSASDREAGLRAYARTAAISPERLQDAARALPGSLTEAELVETIGITALASAIAR
ncbi:MAG: hypothetical protein ABI175_23605, partial [Polyangiales bacterium]